MTPLESNLIRFCFVAGAAYYGGRLALQGIGAARRWLKDRRRRIFVGSGVCSCGCEIEMVFAALTTDPDEAMELLSQAETAMRRPAMKVHRLEENPKHWAAVKLIELRKMLRVLGQAPDVAVFNRQDGEPIEADE